MIGNLNETLLPALLVPEPLLAQPQPKTVHTESVNFEACSQHKTCSNSKSGVGFIGGPNEAWFILRYSWKYFAILPGARNTIAQSEYPFHPEGQAYPSYDLFDKDQTPGIGDPNSCKYTPSQT